MFRFTLHKRWLKFFCRSLFALLAVTAVSGACTFFDDDGCQSTTHSYCVLNESAGNWLRSGDWRGEYSVGWHYLGFDDDLQISFDFEGAGTLNIERDDWPHKWFWKSTPMHSRGGWNGREYRFKAAYDEEESWTFTGIGHGEADRVVIEGLLFVDGEKQGDWEVHRPYLGCIKEESYVETLCEPRFDEGSANPVTTGDTGSRNVGGGKTIPATQSTIQPESTPSIIGPRIQLDYQKQMLTMDPHTSSIHKWTLRIRSTLPPFEAIELASSSVSQSVALPGFGPWILSEILQSGSRKTTTRISQLSPWRASWRTP